MNVDNLSPISRSFYESSRFKVSSSLVLGGFGLMLLGFSSSNGGLAGYAAAKLKDFEATGSIDDIKVYGGGSGHYQIVADGSDSGLRSQISGYGLSCFLFLLGALFLFFLAVYISPLICGSANEKRILKIPQEIDLNDSKRFMSNVHNGRSSRNSSSDSADGLGMSYHVNPGAGIVSRNNRSSPQKAGGNGNDVRRASPKSNNKADSINDPYAAWPQPSDRLEEDSINVSVDR